MSKSVSEMVKAYEDTHSAEEITYVERGVRTHYSKFTLGEIVWIALFSNKCEEEAYDTILNQFKFRPVQGKISAVIIKSEGIYYQVEGRKGTFIENLVFLSKEDCIKECNSRN